MSKLRQRVNLVVKPKKPRNNMEKNPQLKGIVMRVYTMSPKKPNSADRKVLKVVLSNKKRVVVKIGGVGKAGLDKFKKVLVRAGKVRDLPGVKNVVIRGKFDAESDNSRIKRR